MLPYWLMFTLWAGCAVQTERRHAQDGRVLFFAAAAIATTLMIGLRFQVGGDWFTYQQIYDDIYFLPLSTALSITDPGYAALNWVSGQGNAGILFVNIACAALFTGGLARLAWRQPNPALAMLVAVPYLIIVVAMGYTRQAAAIGVVCFAVASASEKNLLKIVVLIGLASLFHKSAVLTLPLLLFPVLRRSLLLGIIGSILFIGLFFLVLRDSSDTLINNYVVSNYDSQGAAIRVAMNVFAGILFLGLRRRMDIPSFQRSYWTVCAALSLASAPALMLASASSGIDRISLYLIPLQSIVFSRIPYSLGRKDRALPSIVLLVICYSFLVQFVWLNYADNAHSWVPYRTVFNQSA